MVVLRARTSSPTASLGEGRPTMERYEVE